MLFIDIAILIALLIAAAGVAVIFGYGWSMIVFGYSVVFIALLQSMARK